MQSSRKEKRTGTRSPRRTNSTSTTDSRPARQPSWFIVATAFPRAVADLNDLVKAQEEWRLHRAINLQASENVMSAEARSLLGSAFAHRHPLPVALDPGLAGLQPAYRKPALRKDCRGRRCPTRGRTELP